MITHDIGKKRFWGIDRAYKVPFIFSTSVHEGEYPFRKCTATGIRYSRSKALLTGKWGPPATDSTAHLLEALKGRHIEISEIEG